MGWKFYFINLKTSSYSINLSATWQEMLKLLEDIRSNHLNDAFVIWKKMKSEHFYVFTCVAPPSPYSNQAPVVPSPATLSTLSSEIINLDSLAYFFLFLHTLILIIMLLSM